MKADIQLHKEALRNLEAYHAHQRRRCILNPFNLLPLVRAQRKHEEGVRRSITEKLDYHKRQDNAVRP